MDQYPHMPTGTTIDPKLLTELVDGLNKMAFCYFNDNPYSFVLADQPRSIFQNIYDKSHVMVEFLTSRLTHYYNGNVVDQ